MLCAQEALGCQDSVLDVRLASAPALTAWCLYFVDDLAPILQIPAKTGSVATGAFNAELRFGIEAQSPLKQASVALRAFNRMTPLSGEG